MMDSKPDFESVTSDKRVARSPNYRLIRKACQAVGDWYQQAGVRSQFTRAFGSRVLENDAQVNCYFSLESVHPILPRILDQASERETRSFELLRLYRHLRFTTVLENALILPTLQDLSYGSLASRLPKMLSLEALKLATDEAFHAQRSEELIHSLEERTKVSCPFDYSEDVYLKAIIELKPDEFRSLRRFCFAFISETIISSTLSKCSKNVKDAEAKDFFKEHIRDEGVHSIFFQAAFSAIWPTLDSTTQEVLAGFLERDIKRFVATPWEEVHQDLLNVGLANQENHLSKILKEEPILKGLFDPNIIKATLSVLSVADSNRVVLSRPFFRKLVNEHPENH